MSSNFINPTVITKDDLKNRILMLLGYPLITVELTDEQLDLCIDRATEIYTKYASFDEEYLIVNLKDSYIPGEGLDLSDTEKYGTIAAVYDLNGKGLANSGLVTDTIWSIPNAMLASGAYPFFGSGGTGAGNWVTYHAACEWLELSHRMTGGCGYIFNRVTKHLLITPEPGNPDSSILLCVERIPPDNALYGNEYVQRFTMAYAKILLGTIRKKFNSVGLLGGGTVDTSIGDEGKEELNQLIENVQRDESTGHGFFIA